MKRSIQFYYFTSVATVLVACVLVMGLMLVFLASTYFSEENQHQLEDVVHNVTDGIEYGDIDITDENNHTIRYIANMGGADIVITDMGGTVVHNTETASSLQSDRLSAGVIEEIQKDGSYSAISTVDGLFPEARFCVAKPLMFTDGRMEGYVVATAGAQGLREYMLKIITVFLASAGVVVAVAGILAFILARRTVVPIMRINAAAQRFADGDFSARAPVEGGGELSQLAVTFNEMAGNFESLDDSRRQFMGNIAHELRTPMTTIKGFIDGLLDGTVPVDQRRKYLLIVSEEVGRLARLTQNMLDISRLESGDTMIDIHPIDAARLVDAVLDMFEQRLADQELAVNKPKFAGPLMVMADEDYLYEVFYNLMDNAVKFSYPGGTIRVRVDVGKTHADISVYNMGAGISQEDMPYIFDRFFKTDQSRGLNNAGSGLGLHICKLLITMMDGRIWAESEENAWMDVHFTLPLAQPKRPGRTQPAPFRGTDNTPV